MISMNKKAIIGDTFMIFVFPYLISLLAVNMLLEAVSSFDWIWIGEMLYGTGVFINLILILETRLSIKYD